MSARSETASASKKLVWTGRVISALPALMLLASSVMKLVKPDDLVKEFTRLGYDANVAPGLGIVEIVCTLI
jgi:hypothetical protein